MPVRRTHSRRPQRSGNAILEMSIVLNLLMWLSMGMVEFGEYIYVRNAFESAARDGGRFAVFASATQTQMNTTISNTLAQANVTYNSNWLTMTQTDPVSNAVTTVNDCSTVPPGDQLTVLISTTYGSLPQAAYIRPFHAITGKGIQDGKVVSGESTFVKE